LTDSEGVALVAAMFTIVGGDGKEYGPVTTEQVRNWISTGRANLDTKAKAAGSDEWRRLGDFAEFGGVAGQPPVIAAHVASAALGESDQTAKLAGIGVRLGAAAIDGFAKTLCQLPTTLIIYRAVSDAFSSGQQPSFSDLLVTANQAGAKSYPYLFALILLQGFLLSTRSQSIGKIVTGIKIVRHPDGSRAGFLHAFLLRGFLPGAIELIPVLGSLFWLVDVCFIFGEQRRCVHDLIAGTKVVKLRA
jgi:uncharacterized RDD family membrane protein YckC